MDSKVDEKPFNQQFGEYVLRYQHFMDDLVENHQSRVNQSYMLQDVHNMIGAAASSLDLTEMYLAQNSRDYGADLRSMMMSRQQ